MTSLAVISGHLRWTTISVLFFCVVLAPQNSPARDQNSQSKQSESTSTSRLTFQDDIAPILKIHCVKCHGGKVKKAGLDVRRRFAILKGGEGGPAIDADDPGDSLFLEMITSGQMPPEEEGRLDARQIDILKRWVALGAPIKGKTEQPLEESAEEIEVTPRDRQFWAFKPPVRLAVPKVKAGDRVRTPIDAFLLTKLEEKQAGFNPDATRACDRPARLFRSRSACRSDAERDRRIPQPTKVRMPTTG